MCRDRSAHKFANGLDHLLRFLGHCILAYAKHLEALPIQESVTYSTVFLAFVGVMRVAIDFDDEHGIAAQEGCEEYVDGDLPCELAAIELPITECGPKFAFGETRLGSQDPRAIRLAWWFAAYVAPSALGAAPHPPLSP